MRPLKRAATQDDTAKPTKPPSNDPPGLQSPLKRVKSQIRDRVIARAARQEIVLSTVEAYRSHVLREESEPPNPDSEVIVTGTLLWKSAHTYSDGEFVKLHITDEQPEESLQELNELEELYNASEENRGLADGVLLTATVFGVSLDSPCLPANGSVVRIINSRNRMLYEGKRCQLVVRPKNISVITP